MQKKVNRVSLGAVHTHTHTSTFKKIRRVANKATLYWVVNRLFVALYEGKNKVLGIDCFSRFRKFIPVGEIFVQRDYADYKEFLCNYYCLEILVMCFLSSKKLILMRKIYTEMITENSFANQGGVE